MGWSANVHKVAVVASFTRLLVVSPTDRIAEVGDVGQIAVDGAFVVPSGVEIIHGTLCFSWMLVLQVNVASKVVVVIFADDHRSYLPVPARFDVYIFVKVFKRRLVKPSSRYL